MADPQKRQPKEFPITNPPADVTNPANLTAREYPRHVYRYAEARADGSAPDGAIVVTWKGKTPVFNTFTDVTDPAAQVAALEDGWALAPVTDAPKPKGEKKADEKPKGEKKD